MLPIISELRLSPVLSGKVQLTDGITWAVPIYQNHLYFVV